MDQPNSALANDTRHPQVTVITVPFRLRDFDLETGHRANTPYGTTLITGHPGPNETLDESARRIVRQWVGTEPQYVEQLYTLSTERTSGREVAVSYIALFRDGQATARADSRMHWSRAADLQISDEVHRKVFDYALVRLKAKMGYTNIAFHLLPPRFTLSELQLTYEHVLGHPVDKRNFRRRMTAARTLVKTQQMRRDGSHRPAALYEFATQDDPAAYLTPSWAAASFASRQDPED
jgi:8-oxo-dGTP diphosphatase